VVLVGKGITFDTGGYSMKRPYDTMMAMKTDMAGAAAVLCVVSALPELAPRVRVTALLMCAENAVSGTAQRPSDVITHFGGTTTEVLNTDAEGRLVLADGLAYADIKLKPDYLIDIATLTGSATLGLGRQYAAMYSRDDKLAAKLHELGNESGDRVWRMPLVNDYIDALESDIADINNDAAKGAYKAGSVTAALFLEKFDQRAWKALEESGALVQRPLWASTGVKDPAYSDTLYVDTLVAPHTVNTMPQSTLDAFLDHGSVKSDAITAQMESASKTLAALSALGISLEAITDALEADGVKKFEDAWISLLADVKKVMA
jgi:hypothetical protein